MDSVDLTKIANIDNLVESGIDDIVDTFTETVYIDSKANQPLLMPYLRLNEIKAETEDRTGQKITWEKVGKDTGLAYTTVLRYAKNRVDRYDSKTMIKFAEYFNVDLSELLVMR